MISIVVTFDQSIFISVTRSTSRCVPTIPPRCVAGHGQIVMRHGPTPGSRTPAVQ